MDFRHLNFICNPNSLCLSAIETRFCLISSGASQFPWKSIGYMCSMRWTLSTNLTLSNRVAHIFILSVPQAQSIHVFGDTQGYLLVNLGFCDCTSIKTGLGDTLHGSESESRDKNFYSRHYNKKMKEGKRDGKPHLQIFRDKSYILHCHWQIK